MKLTGKKYCDVYMHVKICICKGYIKINQVANNCCCKKPNANYIGHHYKIVVIGEKDFA